MDGWRNMKRNWKNFDRKYPSISTTVCCGLSDNNEITDIQYQNQLSQTPNFYMFLQLIATEPKLQISTLKTKYPASSYLQIL
jgi:hypothetical protein